MSVWDQPSPSDADRFLALVAAGTGPYDAAREISGGRLTASRFRSLARRDAEFAHRYDLARRQRELLRAGPRRSVPRELDVDRFRDEVLRMSEIAKTNEDVAAQLEAITTAAVVATSRATGRTPRETLEHEFREAMSDDVWRTSALPMMDEIASVLVAERT